MLLTPRDYQDFGIQEVFKYFESHTGNPLALYPTGTGKSLVCAGICYQALAWYPQTRILTLTHVKELVLQNYNKLKAMWPEAPVGIYCDGLGYKQHHFPVTFGSVGSVVKVAAIFGYIDFVIVDEAHMIAPYESTMYQKIFAVLRQTNPNLKIIGLTATGYRMKQGRLTEGADAIFTDVVVDMTTLDCYNWFFDEGYLVPPIPKPTVTEFDLTNVAIRGGDYDQKALQQEVDTGKKNEAVVLEMLQHSKDRHCGLVFSTGVDHAKHLLEIFEYYGEKATWVASKGMGDAERDRNIADFQRGEYKWMINNGILTTGFDHPPIDFIGMVRHTLSPGLWVQMLGRGTRPLYAPGFDLSCKDGRLASIAASQKRNTMVLDFAQNVTRLGQINDPRIPKPSERKRKGDAPVRICDHCGCYNHASARACWACGYEFPRFSKFDETSGTKELVKVNSNMAPPVTVKLADKTVDFVSYSIHHKTGKPDSLKVTYTLGRKMLSEWICFEHNHAFPRIKAREWWEKRFDGDIPESTEEAMRLSVGLRQPIALIVNTAAEHWEIHDYKFA